MGIWDKVTGQFIDVIEWVDDSRDTLIWKFPRNDNEIKNGAQLIVRESQSAVFLHEGELGDVFQPGKVELTTNNIPILTTLRGWKYAFNSPFKCDVYFVSTRQFTDLKWGTQNPIMLRDAEFGPVRLRAFGSYCVQITDPGKCIKQIAGSNANFSTAEITGQFRNILASRFADALGEAKIPMLDLAANYNEIGSALAEKMQPEFDEYGIKLSKFLIENISLPPAVEEALDKRAQMGVVGNMNTYTQFQTANAMEDMANNPGGGGSNMMGVIAGLGMGNVMGGAMQNAGQAPQQPGAAPPPLPPQIQWYAAINGSQTGPYSATELQQQITQGKIAKDTLIWKQGMENWTAAGQVGEVANWFGTVPPPLPPQ